MIGLSTVLKNFGMNTVVKLFLVCVISLGFLTACSINTRACTPCILKKDSDEKIWTMLSTDVIN